MTNLDNIKLSSSITIGEYRRLENCQDRNGIAKFIQERFTERYITPLKNEKTHGFCIMAVCCLMIEALESFRQGWPDTNERGKGRKAFRYFFDRSGSLSIFRSHADDFYDHIRCGILHQAETTGGWRIRRRDVPLLDSTTKTINATKFQESLEDYLKSYCDELKRSWWNDKIWINLMKKMKAIRANCES